MKLTELSAAHATVQPHQVDYLTNNSPIIASIDWQPSTHGLQHAYQQLTDVVGGGFVDIDGALPAAGMTTKLNWLNLGILGFTIEAGVDIVNQITKGGDFADYLAMRVNKIIQKTSMDTETSLIYDLLLAYAIVQGKAVNAGGTGRSFIIARWSEGDMSGLYDPKGFGQGAMLDTMFLSGGEPYKNKDGKTVYGADFKSYLGFLLANPQCISAIVNIDATHVPTAMMIDDALSDARAGDAGQTFIYGHPKTINLLNEFKGTSLQMGRGETDYNRQIGSWNMIPIVGSYNFKDGDEAAVPFE